MSIKDFREWYIAAIGIVLIVGGLALVSHLTAPANQTVVEGSSQPTADDQSREKSSEAAKPDQSAAKPAEPSPSPAKAPPAKAATQKASPSPAKPEAGTARTAQAPAATAQPSQKREPAAKQQPAPKQQAPASQQAQTQPAPAQTGGHAAHAMGASAADINAGRQAFRKCQACHSLEPARNLIGPSLAGIVGRPAGQVAGYNYSPAMKGSGIVWNAQELDAFLLAPQKHVPKNKMAFPGIKSEGERQNVIAYLATSAQPADSGQAAASPAPAQRAQAPAARPAPPPAAAGDSRSVSYIPGMRYTLRSGIAEGRMVYIGIGGTIDGEVNPILSAAEG